MRMVDSDPAEAYCTLSNRWRLLMLDSILLYVRFAMALSMEFVSDSISPFLLNLQSSNCHSDQSHHFMCDMMYPWYYHHNHIRMLSNETLHNGFWLNPTSLVSFLQAGRTYPGNTLVSRQLTRKKKHKRFFSFSKDTI